MAEDIKDLIGYDRVMVYRVDPDGHGEVVAEAREPRLEPYLGLHYPSSDILQRGRDLYLCNRVRVLADTRYASVPIAPRLSPATDTELDMSMSVLRSLSPIHIEYLSNLGVTGALVASLMKEGRLWGLVSCHHDSPRRLPYQLRATCELLCDVFTTCLTALAAAAVAHSILVVPRVEKQMVETASISGDWHQALFGVIRSLMPTHNATGGALLYERDQVLMLNLPLRRLLDLGSAEVTSLDLLASYCGDPGAMIEVVRRLRRELQPWMGEVTLRAGDHASSLAVRADAVPSPDGDTLGTILLFTDLSARRAAEQARARLSNALDGGAADSPQGSPSGVAEFDDVMAAVLANARTAMLRVSGTAAEAIQPETL